jgi:aminoglycoside phosphotransferase (APT) family kinase protein
VLAHGDLWASNLLLRRGRLTGVVDWDAWHPSAVPGIDLLQLVAVARSREQNRTLAELLPERPWGDPLFAGGSAAYWRAFGIDPVEEVLAAVGVAWWAAQTHSRLRRQPADAGNPEWVRRNVVPVLRIAA